MQPVDAVLRIFKQIPENQGLTTIEIANILDGRFVRQVALHPRLFSVHDDEVTGYSLIKLTTEGMDRLKNLGK